VANAQKNDVLWLDTTGDVVVEAQRPILYGVLMRPSAAAASVVIKADSTSGVIKFEYEISADGNSVFVDLGLQSKGYGIVLTSTFHITVTNMTSVLLYGLWNLKAA
jgi:hypothetical protein